MNGIIHKIADYYKRDRHVISRYARSIGLKTNNLVEISEDDKATILSLYNSFTARELAEKYKVSTSYISALWADNGLKGKEMRVYRIDQLVLDDIDTELKAYFLGFFAADGCLFIPKEYESGHKQMVLRIGVHNEDEYILNLFKELFKTNKPILKVGAYSSLELSSNHICQNLIKYGLDERKTYGNTICILKDEMMRHFLRGYIDGDGCIHKSHYTVSISGYEKNLIKIKNYLEQMNIYMTFKEDKRSSNEKDRFGSLTTTNKTNTYCLLKYLYKNSNYYLTRKKSIADDKIKKIEESNKIRDKEIVNYYKNAVLDKY